MGDPVVTVALLLVRLGSVVAAVTFAVLVIVVPFGVSAETMTTTVKLAEAPAASVPIVAMIVPVAADRGVREIERGPRGLRSPTRRWCWRARCRRVSPSVNRWGRCLTP